MPCQRPPWRRSLSVVLVCTAVALAGCTSDGGGSSGGGGGGQSRSFAMGFTPWPYDSTTEAVDWVFDRVAADGDLISQHLEEGVPWQDMLDGEDFSGDYAALLQDRVNRLEPGQQVLAQINALNVGRDGLALNRGDGVINGALASPWDGYAFNHADVKTAYLNYARKIADTLDPDWLMIGVEVNLLIRNDSDAWDAYLELEQYVYAGLKTSHPDLPVGVSVFCVPFFPEWSGIDNLTAQLDGLADLEPTVDFVAFSVHPFMSALLATDDNLPDGYLDTLFGFTDKPIGVSESSYPAQEWSLDATTWYGTPQKQRNFAKLLLEKSQAHDAQFVVWFSIRDYDQLWSGVLGEDPTALVWRDTGLYDEAGARRLAGDAWRAWKARSYAP